MGCKNYCLYGQNACCMERQIKDQCNMQCDDIDSCEYAVECRDYVEEEEDERAAQPELPKLKNNEERKEFLAKYREWPVWFEVPQAEETYYGYILPDGSAIVICEYKHYNEWWENKYVPGEPEGTLTVEYLLEPGYKHLHNCKTNQTALIRKLMEVQRNGQ